MFSEIILSNNTILLKEIFRVIKKIFTYMYKKWKFKKTVK